LSRSGGGAIPGIAAMCGATLFYSLCDAIGKWLVAEHSVAMLLTVRSVAAAAILAPLIGRRGWRHFWRVDQPWLALARVVAATAETGLFFLAVRHLSLAGTLSIYLAAPLLVAALAPWMLRERVTLGRLIAVGGGFVGILVLLRPGFGNWSPALLLALAGMVALAMSLILTRQLRGIDPIILTAQQIAGTGLAGAMALAWSGPSDLSIAPDLGLMAAVGVTALIAQLLIAVSMRLAEASVVSPFFYSAMLWALLADWLVWAHLPAAADLIGAAVVIASGIWLGRQSLRNGV